MDQQVEDLRLDRNRSGPRRSSRRSTSSVKSSNRNSILRPIPAPGGGRRANLTGFSVGKKSRRSQGKIEALSKRRVATFRMVHAAAPRGRERNSPCRKAPKPEAITNDTPMRAHFVIARGPASTGDLLPACDR
jgi:hypothetical protein